MLLNKAEKLLMNNPLRAAIQRHYEVNRLRELGGVMDGGHALEIGCGRGVGAVVLGFSELHRVSPVFSAPAATCVAHRLREALTTQTLMDDAIADSEYVAIAPRAAAPR